MQVATRVWSAVNVTVVMWVTVLCVMVTPWRPFLVAMFTLLSTRSVSNNSSLNPAKRNTKCSRNVFITYYFLVAVSNF